MKPHKAAIHRHTFAQSNMLETFRIGKNFYVKVAVTRRQMRSRNIHYYAALLATPDKFSQARLMRVQASRKASVEVA